MAKTDNQYYVKQDIAKYINKSAYILCRARF